MPPPPSDPQGYGQGQPPPYPHPPYGYSPYGGGPGMSGSAGPLGEYANWVTRFGGWIIDWLFTVIVNVVFTFIAAVVGVGAVRDIGYLLSLAVWVWFAVQIGQTGASPGMRVVGVTCISERTGQPLGAGMGFLRLILRDIDNLICFVGSLWPLWDQKRQTLLGEKAINAVVVKVPTQSLKLIP